jgi:NAD-dependent dihydropyrimidine dehydrogenase PreA subunit
VELRVTDASVCAAHETKTCYQACPWGVYPLALKDNSACGLCMECVRACPQDNLTVRLRPFGADLTAKLTSKKLDDTFLALVMLASALAFSAVFTGPWGALKSAAFSIGSSAWMIYGAGFLALNLIVLPGLYSLSVWVGQIWAGSRLSRSSFRQALVDASNTLLPLGLFSWIAFTISFALPKMSYVWQVISDPFGWGWDLFGTAHSTWAPDVSAFSSILQVGVLLTGLLWSASTRLSAKSTEKMVARKQIPVLVFCLLYSAALLWLLIG